MLNFLRSLFSRHCDFYKAVTEAGVKGVASETSPATVRSESQSAPQLDIDIILVLILKL